MQSFARGALCVFLLGLTLPAQAQADADEIPNTSTFIGTVRHTPQNLPLADVVVTATSPNLHGELMVSTDAHGRYRLPELPPGKYTLKFEKEGFQVYTRLAIPLGLDQTLRINAKLLAAPPEEPIRVIRPPPSTDLGFAPIDVKVDPEFIQRIAVAQ